MKIDHDEENNTLAYLIAGCVIEKDNKYLLVQEKLEKVHGLWNLPAGRVDFGENFEQAAVREAKEETGFDVEIIKKIDIFQDTVSEGVKHTFYTKITGGELKFPADELLDAKWFSYEDIVLMKDQLRHNWVLKAIDLIRLSE